MAANTSMGTCELCGKTGGKAAMARHVVACAAERDGGAPTEPLVHVRIEAAGAPEYWLHVETGAGASLQQLDKLLGIREGAAMRPAVRVLARNAPLNWPCAQCEAPAVVVCPNCVYTEPSLFCAAHAPSHPCDADDVWLPVVNSPRMGVCGYVGPRSKRSHSRATSACGPRAGRESILS
jgi:hypothetical protein